MGYEIERVVSELNDEFLCSICTLVLENPMQSPCEHLFCNDCIKHWLTVQTTCPIDSCALPFNEIKPTPRYFSNLLSKVNVKCNFESNGCQSIVSLKELQCHLNKCDFDPNAEAISHKECNIKIAKLREEVNQQKEEIAVVTDEVTLNDEITSTANERQRQKEEIMKYVNGFVKYVHETTEDIISGNSPKWHICLNMKTFIDQPRILEYGREDLEAFAQLSSSLEPSTPSFKLKVLNSTSNDDVVIGLTRRGYPTETQPGYGARSVGFCNIGDVYVNGTRKETGRQWGNNDIVECGIRFPNNFKSDGTTDVEIYFAINDQLTFTGTMQMPIDRFFPTVYMWSIGSNNGEVPKVEIMNLF